MEKYTLTSVQRYTTNKDGQPLVSKIGRPYTSVLIKTNTHGDKMLSGFGNAQNANWKPGDEVEIEVEQKGEYLNFSMPKAAGAMDDHTKARIEQIYQEVVAGRQATVMLVQLLKEKGVIPSEEQYAGQDYPEGPEEEPSF